MNYYKHHLGDYSKKTAHLSILEDGCYRRLIDVYYTTEKPLPLDPAACCRLVRARGRAECAAVETVLHEFFREKEDGWHQGRCDDEIAEWHTKSDKARGSAAERWQSGRNANASETHGKRNASHKPLASNHEPVPKSQEPEKPRSTTVTPATAGVPINGGKMDAKSGPAWESYAHAYRLRYFVDPVRNAMVNSKLSQLVDRLGVEAPAVAEFYVSHNNPFYVKSRHPVGLLLQDSEGLRTQWATGVKSTGLEARSEEQKDAVREQILRVSARLENNETH